MTHAELNPKDWKSFVGHTRQRDWFSNAIRSNRLASTFLMVGPDGIGKRTFARLIAKTMLCTGSEPSAFSPCGICETCAQIDASTHPDLLEIARRPEKTGLVMEQLVGEGEMRMREGLCYELRMRPYSGRRKIAIVDDADTIGEEGANCLLKTLEEPPPGSLIFLISTSVQRQLPTIRSRCQMARFQSLNPSDLSQLILRHGIVNNLPEASKLAAQSGGSIGAVANWTNEELSSFRQELFRQLVQRPLDFAKLAKAVQGNMESVGADSQPRRERLKIILDFAIQFYRAAMHAALSRLHSSSDPTKSLEQFGRLLELNSDSMVSAIKRCLEAREHLDRMVSPASLIEAWAADLAIISKA
jgi:DNA polymerase-3 subunit delta'